MYIFDSTANKMLRKLGASVTDDTTDNKLTLKWTTKCQRFAKLKELQADTRANTFAAHLILPNRTKSPPTTLPNEQLLITFYLVI
jgi:Zn-dependent peptidase ImmA (M78 family)